ncbi:MAG TPA: DUF262 domain-containing protein [Bacteroidales bacterium]|nr:DUF262 domain-containing protein [Bacteroidales bacterium]
MEEQINVYDFSQDWEDDIEKEQIDESVRLMEKPFDPTKINIETKTPSLDILIKRIQSKSVAMNTEEYFQRKDDLWDVVKQSRLIESILIRFPLPAFFFDATKEDHWLIVDGLQRLSSIRNFCVLKTLKLTKLEFLTKLNGLGWDDLTDDLQRLIEESQVVIYKIMPGTPTDVKFNIFKRINTGGLVLEPQEIRHALFQGTPATYIAELAQTESFLRATGRRIKTHRMLDRDFANRFLAFYLFGHENYQPDLDTFMSKAMAALNTMSPEQLNKIKRDFSKAMNLASNIFGEEAFRKVRFDHNRLPPINKALFDAIATQFALISDEQRDMLEENGPEFKNTLKEKLNNDEQFFSSITSSTGDKNRVQYRHGELIKLIQLYTS